MKKLFVILTIVVLGLVGSVLWSSKVQTPSVSLSKPKAVVQTTPQVKPVLQPQYHVYAPATPFTQMDAVDPSLYILVAVQVEGASLEDLQRQAIIYTSDGQYLKPLGGNVQECSGCAVFIVPKDALVDSLIYKDFKWYL